MITFKSRQKNIRTADFITRKAHSEYPHVSISRINSVIEKDKVKDFLWGQMALNYACRFLKERYKMESDTKNLYKYVIEAMKNGIGNCSEEAKLAELIAKINGQKNIYSGRIFAGKGYAKHEVAFITDKKIEPDKLYNFKNKEAIILDPWLGITEFAGEYFKSIKTTYGCLLNIRSNSKPKVMADFSAKLNPKKIGELKKGYPQLIIKGFKKIKL